MSYTAKYIQRGDAIDYTPADGLSAGEIVFIGEVAAVAKVDILAGNLGAVAVTGVYDIAKGAGAIAAGTRVYWDASGNIAVTTDNDKCLGVAIATAESGNPYVRVLLNA